MSNSFPLDIWGEILVRLPAECLIRFRDVSKGFRAVIDDPGFVRSHTNNHRKQQKLLLSSKLIIQNYSSSGHLSYSLDLETLINNCNYDGHQTIAAAAKPLHLGFLEHSNPSSMWAAAECNGLVLTQEPFTIWNALTNERLELPTPLDFSTSWEQRWAIGLGYDGTTEDYKAVVILKNRETHVYSLNTDSWRRIINRPPFEGEDDEGHEGDNQNWSLFCSEDFACGDLNWVSWKMCRDKILALDLGTEKYSVLQMPMPMRNNKVSLNVLDGCLAVCDSSPWSQLDVWVMKDFGDEDSWIKLCSIDCKPYHAETYYSYIRHVAFVRKEEKLFVLLQKRNVVSSGVCFFLFDVENNSIIKRVEMDGFVIQKGCTLNVKQFFVGTLFRLHDNCGGAGGGAGVRKKAMKKRKNVE